MKSALAWFLCTPLFVLPLCAASNESWDRNAAADYLDQRAAWWITWKPAARDHETFCISCHTTLPYALARPALRASLSEAGLSPSERRILENVRRRVRLWDQLEPLYKDRTAGDPPTLDPKSRESRGTEAVLNALILTSYEADAHTSGARELSDDTRKALDIMWSLQLKEGDQAGAPSWLNFHNQPWEAGDSQYWGATLAALAAGTAPVNYRSETNIRDNIGLLREYLRRQRSGQSLLNQVGLVWASTRLPGLLNAQERAVIEQEVWSRQREDGGLSASALIPSTWKRVDGTPLESRSDGYATALVSFVLRQAGVIATDARMEKALSWLQRNQDKATGMWPAYSLNKKRDPASDAGKFMSDAATAYAVLTLTPAR